LIHPVPSPICKEFTVKDETNPVVETFIVNTFMDDAKMEPELSVKELRKEGSVKFVFSPLTVDASCVSKKVVLTSPAKF
jgi:hypothetical protein